MKGIFKRFVLNEDGAGIVEYGLLIGILGLGMFEVWSAIKMTLVLSYRNMLRHVRKQEYP